MLFRSSTLKRGYAVVQKNGKLVKSTKDVEVADALEITLAKGELTVEVLSNKIAKGK